VKRLLTMAAVLILVLWAGPLGAEVLVLNSTQPSSLTPSITKGPFYYQSASELRMRKLVRGFANVGLSVAEIPNQIFQEAYKTSPVTGFFTGTVKGIIKGAKRIVVGAWEVLTFYHPMNNHYQPIVEPEVVFMEYLH